MDEEAKPHDAPQLDGSGDHAVTAKSAEDQTAHIETKAGSPVKENNTEATDCNDTALDEPEDTENTSGNGNSHGSNHEDTLKNLEDPSEVLEDSSEKTSEVSESLRNHVDSNEVNNVEESESKSETDTQILDAEPASGKENLAENESQPDEADSEQPIEHEENELDSQKDTVDSQTNDVDESKLDDSQNNENDEIKNDNDSQEGNDSQAGNDSQVNECSAEEVKDPDDDIENPKFENAPEHTETTQEDHTEALDPFDELLKGAEEAPADKSTASQGNVATLNDDDDDNHDGGDHHDADGTQDVDNYVPADTEAAELVEEPGADEEVCLLPDTEREISEADKEKALEKRKQAESESAQHSGEAKNEPEPELAAETTETDFEAPAHEEAEPAEQPDTTAEPEEPATTEDADKEKENDETAEVEESLDSNVIQEIGPVDNLCTVCSVDKPCTYKYLKDGVVQYICTEMCVKAFREKQDGYVISGKKYIITEINPALMTCSECEEEKTCYFYYNFDGVDTNYCSMTCLHSMMADEQHKYFIKKKKLTVEEILEREATCEMCSANKCSFTFNRYGEKLFICSMPCIKNLNESDGNRYNIKLMKKKQAKKTNIPILKQPMLKLKVISNATDKYLDERRIQAKTPAAAAAAREDRERSFIRKCVQCSNVVSGDEKNLSWETMDFCNEACLGRYQNFIGAKCANCKNSVNNTSLGKYCVRFGYDIRQFCCSGCLEEFKKGLKICCYCQRDISAGYEGFLAPVGDKGQFKDFCSQQCMEKFEQMSKNPVPQPVWAKCAVCSVEKPTQIEVGIDEDHSQRLCSEPCFAAFKFVNSICPDQCRWCKKYFERRSANAFTIYTELSTHCFCSKSCLNVYISNSRQIVPCNWCKVKKYNFDMIRRALPNGQGVMMCSLNCLNLYQVSINAVSSRRIKCDQCKRTSQAQYHLTMSDATVRNFCTYQCVMSFQGQYTKHGQPIMVGEQTHEQPKAVPTGAPRRTYANTTRSNSTQKQQQTRSSLPVISNVQSLATPPSPVKPVKSLSTTRAKSKRLAQQQHQPPPEPEPPRIQTPPPPPKPPTPPPPPPPKIYNHVLVKTLPPVDVANKATMTKPMMVTKGVSCRPHPCTKECQTDPSLERRVLIPVPVPIYVPVPIAMYSLPFPIPIPIPLPIPTPVFIPTTRNSAKGILKEITKIHDKMPTDPFEAELLMMAEMVAGDKKKSESDSETDDENDEGFSPDAMDGGNAFGEDMLQMALKMASEYEEPAVDLESAMTASTITPSSHPGMPGLEGEAAIHHHHQMMVLEQQRAVAALRATNAQQPATRGKRAPAAAAPVTRTPRSSKRRKAEPMPPAPEPVREPVEKPDANMCLKYTFGVNAWKQWVMTKNAEIEKSSIRRKPFKSEILQLTADELNYSLCLFVKEVRKPNGSEYAPDTIYYLVLGIQQYLFENGRIDNIFTDPYYEKFTECLDEVARKFSVLYNDSQYIVTRVEEEHLWESKQLGAHSPHVLLSTLMFFNTKHFNLVTVEEHMQLSFSHIMKHWKRNPNQPGAAKMPGSRNVLLRFYPPQSALEANSRKKKVYEQQENEENPLRCPVKLYEFYISKCCFSPESVRTRNDVFYLMPERSCVPDSPVWYSTQALGRDALAKMLHRVKMVKEINIALLTS